MLDNSYSVPLLLMRELNGIYLVIDIEESSWYLVDATFHQFFDGCSPQVTAFTIFETGQLKTDCYVTVRLDKWTFVIGYQRLSLMRQQELRSSVKYYFQEDSYVPSEQALAAVVDYQIFSPVTLPIVGYVFDFDHKMKPPFRYIFWIINDRSIKQGELIVPQALGKFVAGGIASYN